MAIKTRNTDVAALGKAAKYIAANPQAFAAEEAKPHAGVAKRRDGEAAAMAPATAGDVKAAMCRFCQSAKDGNLAGMEAQMAIIKSAKMPILMMAFVKMGKDARHVVGFCNDAEKRLAEAQKAARQRKPGGSKKSQPRKVRS